VNFDEAAEAAFECLGADPKTFTGKQLAKARRDVAADSRGIGRGLACK
jgi:hypothetical protein